VKCFGPLNAVRTKGTPAEMIVRGDLESAGWIEWRLLPCGPEFLRPLEELERASGTRLPPSFRRWYGSRYTLDVDVSVVRLPANPSNDPCAALRNALMAPGSFNSAARALGLIPFGDEAMMDAGPLCFDPRGGGDPDAWPVTYWDHEWAETDREIGPVIFSSFDRLLLGCIGYMREFERVQRSVFDPDRWLDHRPSCIRALMAADPGGAGGPGRDYWTMHSAD
jgi:hypothetical protein